MGLFVHVALFDWHPVEGAATPEKEIALMSSVGQALALCWVDTV